MTPAASLLLTAAMSEARAVGDPAGNWKLAKSTQGGRRRRAKDDAAAAAILAVAIGTRRASAAEAGRLASCACPVSQSLHGLSVAAGNDCDRTMSSANHLQKTAPAEAICVTVMSGPPDLSCTTSPGEKVSVLSTRSSSCWLTRRE